MVTAPDNLDTIPGLAERRARMRAYLTRGERSVSGWLARESGRVIALLAEDQIRRGVTGAVGEIGIHHGKLFLLLYLSLQPGERAFAVDVFGDQTLNRDLSGQGDKQIFLRNLARIGGEAARVTLFEQDSTTLRPADILDAVGPVKLISVDGGHTQEVTRNDLALAQAVLRPEGIVVLDDVYHERWPAVAAGAYAFLAEAGTRLRPFAISPNKTYFCQDPVAAAGYRTLVKDAFASQLLGTAEMFGSEVVIVGRTSLANRIRNMPVIQRNPELYRALSSIWQRLRGRLI